MQAGHDGEDSGRRGEPLPGVIDDWDLTPNPCMIRGFAHESISKEAFVCGVSEWLASLGFLEKEHWTVAGTNTVLSQVWDIIFVGSEAVGSRHCKAALQGLKLGPAQWLTVWASTPLGRWVQLHFSPDKNGCRRATEMSTKRLLEALLDIHPNLADDAFAMRTEGVVFLSMVPLCRVVPSSDGSCKLEWSLPLAGQAKVECNRVQDRFEASAADQGGATGLRAKASQTKWQSCP